MKVSLEAFVVREFHSQSNKSLQAVMGLLICPCWLGAANSVVLS